MFQYDFLLLEVTVSLLAPEPWMVLNDYFMTTVN